MWGSAGFLFDDFSMGGSSRLFAGLQWGAILAFDGALARAVHVFIRLPLPVLLSKVARRNGYPFRPRIPGGPPLTLLGYTDRSLGPALLMMSGLNFDKFIVG